MSEGKKRTAKRVQAAVDELKATPRQQSVATMPPARKDSVFLEVDRLDELKHSNPADTDDRPGAAATLIRYHLEVAAETLTSPRQKSGNWPYLGLRLCGLRSIRSGQPAAIA